MRRQSDKLVCVVHFLAMGWRLLSLGSRDGLDEQSPRQSLGWRFELMLAGGLRLRVKYSVDRWAGRQRDMMASALSGKSIL